MNYYSLLKFAVVHSISIPRDKLDYIIGCLFGRGSESGFYWFSRYYDHHDIRDIVLKYISSLKYFEAIPKPAKAFVHKYFSRFYEIKFLIEIAHNRQVDISNELDELKHTHLITHKDRFSCWVCKDRYECLHELN